MKKTAAMVVPILLVFLFTISSPAEGTLFPLLDRSGSLLSELWPERLADPFRVLEQIPLGLDKDELVVPPARVDWKETTDSHIIMLDVPGLRKEDLKIEVDDNRVLRISGERKKEEAKKGDHWHRVERVHGKFWRQFRLPENVDLDSITARLENGVLTINLKKLSPDQIKEPRVVSIAAEEGGEMITGKPETKSEL